MTETTPTKKKTSKEKTQSPKTNLLSDKVINLITLARRAGFSTQTLEDIRSGKTKITEAQAQVLRPLINFDAGEYRTRFRKAFDKSDESLLSLSHKLNVSQATIIVWLDKNQDRTPMPNHRDTIAIILGVSWK